jgi:putative transposase
MKTLKVEAVYRMEYETFEDVLMICPDSSMRCRTRGAYIQRWVTESPAQFEEEHARQFVKTPA